MRKKLYKKSEIIAEANLSDVSNKMSSDIESLVDTAEDALDIDEPEAKKVASAYLSEDEDTSGRAIEYGITEPELGDDSLGPKVQDLKSKIKYSEKKDSRNDLPFESVVKESLLRKTIKYNVKELRNGK